MGRTEFLAGWSCSFVQPISPVLAKYQRDSCSLFKRILVRVQRGGFSASFKMLQASRGRLSQTTTVSFQSFFARLYTQ